MSTKVSRSSKKVESEVKHEPVQVPAPAPVPEPVEDDAEDVEGDESKKHSVDDLLESQANLIKQGMQLLSQAKAMNQSIRRAHNQALRQQSQRKKVRKTVVHSGILKLVALPPEAETFLKAVGVAIPESREMRRTDLSGAIYDYVKANNLYKPDPSKESGYDRKVIIPDIKLRTLFTLTPEETLDFSSINRNLAKVYKTMKDAAEGLAPAPVAAPVVTKAVAPAAAAPAKKGKVAGSSA
jgi:hypothetical protein